MQNWKMSDSAPLYALMIIAVPALLAVVALFAALHGSWIAFIVFGILAAGVAVAIVGLAYLDNARMS